MSLIIYSIFLNNSFICSLGRITSPFSLCRPHTDYDISVENWCLGQQHWWQSSRCPGSGRGPPCQLEELWAINTGKPALFVSMKWGSGRVYHRNFQATPTFIHSYFIATPLDLFNFTWSNYCLMWVIIYKTDEVLFFRGSTHICT